MKPELITMRGPSDSSFYEGVDDITLGLLVLDAIAKENPGITVSGMLNLAASRKNETMAGYGVGDFFRQVGNVVKAPIDYVGDKISDAVGMVGRVGGDTVRLAADEQVQAGVSRLAAAYATGGTSEAAGGIGSKIADFLGNLGATVRQDAGGVNVASAGFGGVPGWAIAGGFGLLVLSLLFGRRR